MSVQAENRLNMGICHCTDRYIVPICGRFSIKKSVLPYSPPGRRLSAFHRNAIFLQTLLLSCFTMLFCRLSANLGRSADLVPCAAPALLCLQWHYFFLSQSVARLARLNKGPTRRNRRKVQSNKTSKSSPRKRRTGPFPARSGFGGPQERRLGRKVFFLER